MTVDWQTLPTEPHDSLEEWRRGRDEEGEQLWEPVPCGEWYNGGKVYCQAHLDYYAQEYPQGWASYPGDVCMHGRYTGGCGIDWICGDCENGYTRWVDDPQYKLILNGDRGAPEGLRGVEVTRWSQESYDPDRFMKAVHQWDQLVGLDYDLNWHVEQINSGYWAEELEEK
jgi:hypothetical protein